jgi:hypothetical protein
MAHLRTIVVGDIHGCLEELRLLIAKVGAREGDRYVFLGDLIHKGPDSEGVVQLVKALIAELRGSVCIAGNHESMELSKPTGELSEDSLAFLRTLPMLHRFAWTVAAGAEPRPCVAVHGGFFPDFFVQHGEVGEVPAAWHRGGGKRMERMRRFLRVRYVNAADGSMVALGQNDEHDPFWADCYDGREGLAFFGHSPWNGVVRTFPHAIGVDSGCVFGRTLSAVVLTEGSPSYEVMQIEALQRYSQPMAED